MIRFRLKMSSYVIIKIRHIHINYIPFYTILQVTKFSISEKIVSHTKSNFKEENSNFQNIFTKVNLLKINELL